MATLQELIESEICDFFAGFGSPGDPETQEDMQSQLLARIAPLLASMEQEPVYQACKEAGVWVDVEPDEVFALRANGEQVRPLYAAPQLPQPAVISDVRIQKAVAWLDGVINANPGMKEPVTCRSAMLQGAEPVRQANKLPAACWCHTCRPLTMSDMRFVVCPECGNKRCPHANDHRNACTGSNEPGQEGSAYPAAPQQEA